MASKTTQKRADTGGQDTPFEQAFANLAHAHLKDKAPSLLDYEIGFQLVDRNQDNTKAIGVFGFKVGSQWLYAPVFFLNGELKGHELLYVKNQDNFVPMKENWLSYILNRKPNVLGKAVDKNLSNLGILPPHLYQLSRSPHKFASHIPKMAAWAQQVMPDLAAFATQNPLEDSKYADVRSVPDFIKDAGARAANIFAQVMTEYPQLEKTCCDVYGRDTIIASMRAAQLSLRKEASVLAARPTPKAARQNVAGVLGLDLRSKLSSVQSKIKIAKLEDVQKAPDGLNQGFSGIDGKQKEEVVRAGVVIEDTRGPEETTLAYRMEGPEQLSTPYASGLYDVLTAPGNFERCYVVIGPYSARRRNGFCTVFRVSDASGKGCLNTHPSNIWVSNKIEDKEFDKWWDGLEEANSLTPRPRKSTEGYVRPARYVLISKTGEGTTPFSVDSEIIDEAGYRTYNVSFDDYASKERAGYLPRLDSGTGQLYGSDAIGHDAEYDCEPPRITLTERAGGRMRLMRGELFVPAGTRIVKIREEDSDDNCCGCTDKDEPLTLANLATIQMRIINKSPKLMLRKMGNGFVINGHAEKNTVDSLVHLVRQHGLAQKQASLLLSEAAKDGKSTYVLKYAAPWDLLNQGPSAPSDPGPYTGYDPMTSGNVPTQYHSEYMQNIPEMSAANTDRSVYAPNGPEPKYQQGKPGPDRQSLQVAMDASQTGQKEVFDTAMLGSLLKATKDENLVDRYMGDLMKGIDRLGRILFMFYWHQEEFEDRYGKDDLIELEDGLRNAFEALGDITLFLRQKTVDPNPQGSFGPDIENLSDV